MKKIANPPRPAVEPLSLLEPCRARELMKLIIDAARFRREDQHVLDRDRRVQYDAYAQPNSLRIVSSAARMTSSFVWARMMALIVSIIACVLELASASRALASSAISSAAGDLRRLWHSSSISSRNSWLGSRFLPSGVDSPGGALLGLL